MATKALEIELFFASNFSYRVTNKIRQNTSGRIILVELFPIPIFT